MKAICTKCGSINLLHDEDASSKVCGKCGLGPLVPIMNHAPDNSSGVVATSAAIGAGVGGLFGGVGGAVIGGIIGGIIGGKSSGKPGKPRQ